ncbi:hypothetical protein [Streptomyces sp. 184]|uniref:hypothetical protein n=1 Tax=Streptomyces sp. 184 TaxID=1827526 RepID=UPI0038928EAE
MGLWPGGRRRKLGRALSALHGIIEPEVRRLVAAGEVSPRHATEIGWDAVVLVLKGHFKRGRDVDTLRLRGPAGYRHVIKEAARNRDPRWTEREPVSPYDRLVAAAAEAGTPEERAALEYMLVHEYAPDDRIAQRIATALALGGMLDEAHMRAARESYDRRLDNSLKRGEVPSYSPEEVVRALFPGA